MMHFTDVSQAQSICEGLSASARVEILKQVLSHKAESLDALAKTLHLSNGAITQHVKKLCDLGLIKLVGTPGKRGVAKKCVVTVDRIIIDITDNLEIENTNVFDIPIGSFSAAAVKPYCAIATSSGFLGERDDPRYFTYPERTDALLIYFNSGKIGWTLPVPPSGKAKLRSISVSLELSSKPYGHGRYRESEVTFFLNDVKLGEHTVNGEYSDRKGLFTPERYDDMCQYGKYKTVTVNEKGSFFDGIKLSDRTLNDVDTAALTFSLSTENGVAIFGKGYGDYDCGIRCKIEW